MEPLQYNIHEAKTRLSQLIRFALSGKEVIIAKGNKPLVRLEVLPEAHKTRAVGNAKGLILSMSDDFDEPLEDFSEYME
jgi:antitoxin (DNA-binding transcriptional repressor) of toxin-antitoxin stability system